MSGIYISGMEMPREGFVEILIRDDGTAMQTGQSYRIDGTDYYAPYVTEKPDIYKAIPVPEHGRLIDADALITKVTDAAIKQPEIADVYYELASEIGLWLYSMPTIIPASGGNENE